MEKLCPECCLQQGCEFQFLEDFTLMEEGRPSEAEGYLRYCWSQDVGAEAGL